MPDVLRDCTADPALLAALENRGQADAGVKTLARVCEQLRNQPHRVLFLPGRPVDPEGLQRALSAHCDPLYMRMTVCELQFCAWYGQRVLTPEQLPPMECLAELSNSSLQEEVRDLLDKLTNRRILELAVYQKVLDIINSGWE